MNNGVTSEQQQPGLRISIHTIHNVIAESLLLQRRLYSNSASLEASTSNSGSAPVGVPSEIKLNDCLEMEHIDGSICGVVKGQEALSTSVSVFPVYCPTNTRWQANTVLCEAMKTSPAYLEFVPDKTALREASTLTGDDLKRRNDEEEYRNYQEQNLIKLADDALKTNKIDTALFSHFLIACRKNNALWEGVARPDMSAGRQWIVPMRVDANHYTVLVIHFTSNQHVSVKYYNSSGKDIAPDTKAALIEFFRQRKVAMDYQCFSKYDQRGEGNNCGVFVFYNAIKLACENIQIANPLGENWIKPLSDASSPEYQKVFRNARLLMAGILRSNGQNVSVTQDLLKPIDIPNRVTPQFTSTLEYKKHLDKNLQGLMENQAKEPSAETEAKINRLIFKIQAFNQVLDEQQAHLEEDDNIILQMFGKITSFSWKTLIGSAAVAVLFYLYAWPFVMIQASSLLTAIGLMLPANPFVTIFGGGLIFAMGLGLMDRVLGKFLGGENGDANTAEALKKMPVPTPTPLSESNPVIDIASTPSTFTPLHQAQEILAEPQPTTIDSDNETTNNETTKKERPNPGG